MQNLIFNTLFTLILAVAAKEDAGKGRIPGKLILAGIAIGGIKAILSGGTYGMFCCIRDLILVGGVFCLFYFFGRLGAGDVKLFAMTAAFLGLPAGVFVIVVTFCVALFLALSAVVQGMIKKKSMREILSTPVKLAPAELFGWVIYLGGRSFV